MPASHVFPGMTPTGDREDGLMDEHPTADETNQDDEQAEPVAGKRPIVIGPGRRLGVLIPTDLIGMYYLG